VIRLSLNITNMNTSTEHFQDNIKITEIIKVVLFAHSIHSLFLFIQTRKTSKDILVYCIHRDNIFMN